MTKIFGLKRILKSLGFACRGLKSASEESSFRFFCFIAFLVLILMMVLKISDFQKLIVMVIGN